MKHNLVEFTQFPLAKIGKLSILQHDMDIKQLLNGNSDDSNDCFPLTIFIFLFFFVNYMTTKCSAINHVRENIAFASGNNALPNFP